MAEAVPIVRIATLLTPIPRPPDALAASRRTWLDDNPLERAVEGSTTLLLATSDFIESYFTTAASEETVHITGVRFDDGVDGRQVGYLTLDGRNPAGATDPYSSGWSNEYPHAYALDEDTYLIVKRAGPPDVDWARPGTWAWIVSINSTGQPSVVDEVFAQGPAGYDPFSGKLVFSNPPESYLIERFTAAYAAQFPVGVADDKGAFSYAVSPTGFGVRSGLADPPTPPSNLSANRLMTHWPYPGVGINAGAHIAHYTERTSGGAFLRAGLYDPAAGTMTTLAATPDTIDPSWFATPGGDPGDVATGVENVMHGSGSFAGDRIFTFNPGAGLVTRGAAWLFQLTGDEVVLASAFQDRTFIQAAERRVGTFYRTLALDPPYTSLQDVWDRNQPLYTTYFGDYATFSAAYIDYYGSEEAAVAGFNATGGTSAGTYFGFQGAAADDTEWGVWETDADSNRNIRMVARNEAAIYTLFPGFLNSGVTPNVEVLPRLIRWDAPEPAIVGVDDGVRRRFV